MRNFESNKTIKTAKLTSVLLFGPLARQMPVGSQYHAIRAFLYQAMDEYQMHTDDSNFSCGNNDPFLISPLKIHQLRVPTIKKTSILLSVIEKMYLKPNDKSGHAQPGFNNELLSMVNNTLIY